MKKTIILGLGIWLLEMAVLAAGTSFDPSRNSLAARQVGLGGLSLLFADDANGAFANPAGLTNLEFPQLLAAARKQMLDETQYSLLEWALPTTWGTFGLGYTAMSISGSLPTALDPATGRIMIDPSREAIAYSNSVLGLAYARDVRPNLSLGGMLKFFNQSFSGSLTSRGTGNSLDLSAKYTPLSWLALGANLQNVLGGTLQWQGGGSDKIGGYYKFGGKVNLLGATAEAYKYYPQDLMVGLDLDLPHDSLAGSDYHLGAEYYPQKNLALRAGLSGSGLSLGIGMTNSGFRFDYAYALNSAIPGDNPQYFSLAYLGDRIETIGKRLKQKLSIIRFLAPKARLITSAESVAFVAEVKAARVLSQRTVWTVPSISETFEVREVTESELLRPVYINGIKVDQVGTIEGNSPLTYGRNVINITGFTSPEPQIIALSGEAVILRVSPFNDTPLDFWAAEPIYLSVALDLVKGYPNNLFKPEKGITRAELVALLVRTLGVRDDELLNTSKFKDIPEKSWATKYVNHAAEKNLVSGYPDGEFKPNKVLNRAEGVAIMARYAELTKEATGPLPFPDLKEKFWANEYIAAAKAAGLLAYLAGKDFEPAKPFARAEACAVLTRTPRINKHVEEFWTTGLVSSR